MTNSSSTIQMMRENLRKNVSRSKIARKKARKIFIYRGYPLNDESEYEPTERLKIAMAETEELMREYEERKKRLNYENI